eukprot:gene9500-9309_t
MKVPKHQQASRLHAAIRTAGQNLLIVVGKEHAEHFKAVPKDGNTYIVQDPLHPSVHHMTRRDGSYVDVHIKGRARKVAQKAHRIASEISASVATRRQQDTPPEISLIDIHRVMLISGFGRSFIHAHPTFPVPSLDERKAMLVQLRSLLTVEVMVDLTKFSYTDNSGLDLQLPQDYKLWNPSSMPEGPVAIIWNRFCWESWLQADLLNEADEVDPEDFKPHLPLTWEMQEVAKAYFSGGYLQRHPQIDGNPKKFEKYREALIARAGIDILNPWAFAQLNLGKELKQDFALANRFLPQQHGGVVPHTLAQQTAGAAIRKLDASMQDKPGWSFDASDYEDSDE